MKEIFEPQEKTSDTQNKGWILYGPPGTGKTMIAQAIANETISQYAFISISGSDLFNISNISKVLNKAEENAPCIVFIDEIDGFGKIRVPDSDDAKFLNHFLSKFGGSKPVQGVKVIAATNHLGCLDPALIREGRLSKHIEIPALDGDRCRKIMTERLNKILGDKTLAKVCANTRKRQTDEICQTRKKLPI